MASLKGLAGVAAVAVLFHCALAATISVGGPSGGWDLSTNFATWAASQKFAVGDTLVFQYTATHDVVEVTKANYDNCNAGNPINTYTGGNTVIALSAPGKRYFICGTAGHCAGGMKLEVDVAGGASTPAAPPPKAPSPPPTASPAPPKASPPPAPTASPAPPKASPPPAPTATPATPPPMSAAPSPRPPKNSPSPSPQKSLPPPSIIVPEPTAPAQPLPPRASPPSPGPAGFAPRPPPSAAGGLKASAAAAFACGLLLLLALQ